MRQRSRTCDGPGSLWESDSTLDSPAAPVGSGRNVYQRLTFSLLDGEIYFRRFALAHDTFSSESSDQRMVAVTPRVIEFCAMREQHSNGTRQDAR